MIPGIGKVTMVSTQGTGGSVIISDNRISNNIASNNGGGIFVYGVATISNNIIINNTVASNGGGID